MKIRCRITGIFFCTAILISMQSCAGNENYRGKPSATGRDTANTKVHQTNENMFYGLRKLAIDMTPEDLGISLPADQTVVFGVVMDWGINGGTASTVAWQTGESSLYLSSGGGVIGGGQEPGIIKAAKLFVLVAQAFLEKAVKTETTPLPAEDEVKFYLLTNKGIYSGSEQMKNFEDSSSPWLKLFEEGNVVLTELRKTLEKRSEK